MGIVRLMSRRDWALLGLLAALPLLGYQFGEDNQVEQFPIIGRLSDPDFLRGDFYVDSAAGFGPRYYYSLFVSLLTNVAPLPAVILILTYLTNFGVAALAFLSARRHFGAGAAGAAIAAALVVVNNSFSLGLASALRFDSFQPASIAIPLSLAAFALLIDGRRYWAAAAFCLSALFHPLVGTEVALIAFAACAAAEISTPRPLLSLLKYFPSGAVFACFVVAVWLLPAASINSEPISNSEFFAILPTFRSPHHYLAAVFPVHHYAAAAAFTAALAMMVWMARRAAGKIDFVKTAYVAAALVAVALCMFSALFVDVMHDRLWATAQVFRNLFVLKWVGFLFFSSFASSWFSTARPAHVIAPVAVLIATADAQPYMMLASIATITALDAVPQRRRHDLIVAAVLLISSTGLTIKFGAEIETSRAVVAAAIVAMLFTLTLTVRTRAVIGVALTLTLAAFGMVNRKLNIVDMAIFEPAYSWADWKGPKADIARWAKQNAPADSIWLIPPDLESFRLFAERPVVVDFTSIPFDGAAMREWRRRMEILYGPTSGGGFTALKGMNRNYRAITPASLAEANTEFGADYAVLYGDTEWSGPVLYENKRYKAVRISP